MAPPRTSVHPVAPSLRPSSIAACYKSQAQTALLLGLQLRLHLWLLLALYHSNRIKNKTAKSLLRVLVNLSKVVASSLTDQKAVPRLPEGFDFLQLLLLFRIRLWCHRFIAQLAYRMEFIVIIRSSIIKSSTYRVTLLRIHKYSKRFNRPLEKIYKISGISRCLQIIDIIPGI